jgi:putative ABC transport system substrate-binding protein
VTIELVRSLRRFAIFTVSLASLAGALAASAQDHKAAKTPRIGMLWAFSVQRPEIHTLFDAFRDGIREFGYAEGRNIAFEHRWAEGRTEPLADLAAQLVQLKVDVIVVGSTASARAAKQATTTIPIVAATMADPVSDGLVASLARPGGNIRGLTFLGPELGAKRLELFKEAVPRVSRVAVLWHPGVYGERTMKNMANDMEAAARLRGVRLQLVEARGLVDFDKAFSAMVRERADALIVLPSPIFFNERKRIVDLAAKHRMPAMYPYRESVEDGGLMAYATNTPDLFRRAAAYVAKILGGAAPEALPVQQPTKFELIINVKTARALGVTIPPSLLVRADQVIQ